MEPRYQLSRGPTRFNSVEGNITGTPTRVFGGLGAVGDPGMCGRSLHGNREILAWPAKHRRSALEGEEAVAGDARAQEV